MWLLYFLFSLISVGNTADYDGRIIATRELDLGTENEIIIKKIKHTHTVWYERGIKNCAEVTRFIIGF